MHNDNVKKKKKIYFSLKLIFSSFLFKSSQKVEQLTTKGGTGCVSRVGQWFSCRLDMSVWMISVQSTVQRYAHEADGDSFLSVSADGSLSLNVA